LRVEEVDSGNDYAVEIVERLGVDNGLMTKSGGNVHEDTDGTLWLSTVFGVLRIPGEIRDASPRIPRVEFVRFDAGDETHPVDGANHTLPPSQNDIALGFAALTFKDRTGLRYRVRARANDPWSETRSAELRFVGLAPGRYRPEVAASLDGERWSATTASLEFTVLPPWHRTVWAGALFFLFGSAVLYGVYRARVAILLRFERQRTRIAMDLHDEMGSRLGSIRILSDLLRDDSVEPAARPSIVDQIAGSAEELSATLADIVWSLRPRVRTLRAVLDRLEVRANEFVPTGRVQVAIGVPVDDVVVSVAVCKNLLSIGSEALHNAVRHGKADRLRICLDRATGRAFQLRVADNGAGFDAAASSGDGLGLVSMRTRVEEIGGSLTIDSTPGEGTTVTVRFAPREYRT
jgi:signal transduction histidine kinase